MLIPAHEKKKVVRKTQKQYSIHGEFDFIILNNYKYKCIFHWLTFLFILIENDK